MEAASPPRCGNKHPLQPDDLGYAPFSQRGTLGRVHQLFGEQLGNLLEELNQPLVA
jgi:type I restriction enzyme R subunit